MQDGKLHKDAGEKIAETGYFDEFRPLHLCAGGQIFVQFAQKIKKNGGLIKTPIFIIMIIIFVLYFHNHIFVQAEQERLSFLCYLYLQIVYFQIATPTANFQPYYRI